MTFWDKTRCMHILDLGALLFLFHHPSGVSYSPLL